MQLSRSLPTAVAAVAALAMTAVPALPGGDAPAPVAPAGAVGLPTDTSLDLLPATDPASIRQALELDASPEAYLRAVAAHLAAAWGSPGVVLLGAEQGEVGTAHVAEPMVSGTYAFDGVPLHADGDGLHDLLVPTEDIDTGQRAYVAISGIDGHELWRVDAPGRWYGLGTPVGDLTGDGTDELLTVDFDIVSSTAEEACEEQDDTLVCTDEGLLELVDTITVRSGHDGTVLWTRTAPQVFAWSTTTTTGSSSHEWRDSVRSLDVDAFPVPAGDIDGDGLDDVLLTSTDARTESWQRLADTDTGETDEGYVRPEVGTLVEVLHGGTGDVLTTFASDEAFTGTVDAVGDTTGDGTSELAWTRTPAHADEWSCERILGVQRCDDPHDAPATTGSVELLDLAAGTTLWSRTTSRSSSFFSSRVTPLHDDLDGDGVVDLLVVEDSSDPVRSTVSPFADDLVAVSGADGSALWVVEHPTGRVDAVADVDEDGTPDVLFLWTGGVYTVCSGPLPDEVDPCESGYDVGLTMTALSGADGTELRSSHDSFPVDEDETVWFWSWGAPRADHDGDGLTDALFSIVVDGDDSTRSEVLLRSTGTGEELLRLTEDGTTVPTRSLGDLDGDGAAEFSVYDLDEETKRVLHLPTMTVLHEIHATDLHLVRAGDQDGDGADDLVRVRHEVDEADHARAFLEGLTGITLDLRWTTEITGKVG